MAEVIYNNADENRFWLQIMGDNARIILNSLNPNEVNESNKIRDYIFQFDDLLSKARQNLTPDQLDELNSKAFSAIQDFRKFLLHLLDIQVTKGFFILLKPAIINNMIDLAEQYLNILYAFINHKQPQFDPFSQDVKWLPLFITQARYISDSVGFFQVDLRQRAERFAVAFQNLMTFAIELIGIHRIGKTGFPIEIQHRYEMLQILKEYAEFLGYIMILVQQNRMPGTLSIEYMDRTNRIVCYYAKQLAALSNASQPDCDPTNPGLDRY